MYNVDVSPPIEKERKKERKKESKKEKVIFWKSQRKERELKCSSFQTVNFPKKNPPISLNLQSTWRGPNPSGFNQYFDKDGKKGKINHSKPIIDNLVSLSCIFLRIRRRYLHPRLVLCSVSGNQSFPNRKEKVVFWHKVPRQVHTIMLQQLSENWKGYICCHKSFLFLYFKMWW